MVDGGGICALGSTTGLFSSAGDAAFASFVPFISFADTAESRPVAGEPSCAAASGAQGERIDVTAEITGHSGKGSWCRLPPV